MKVYSGGNNYLIPCWFCKFTPLERYEQSIILWWVYFNRERQNINKKIHFFSNFILALKTLHTAHAYDKCLSTLGTRLVWIFILTLKALILISSKIDPRDYIWKPTIILLFTSGFKDHLKFKILNVSRFIWVWLSIYEYMSKQMSSDPRNCGLTITQILVKNSFYIRNIMGLIEMGKMG